MLVYLMIVLLSLVILRHFLPIGFLSLREGMEERKVPNYSDYQTEEKTDPMFLATKNAANISYLKSQLDQVTGLKQMVQDLSGNVTLNTFNISELVKEIGKSTSALSTSAGENLKPLDTEES